MKKLRIISSLLLLTILSSTSEAKYCPQIKIAIVDTGLDLTDPRFKNHICETGHKNFIKDQTLDDIHGHGTHVAGLIQKYAGRGNYCFLIYKYYSDANLGFVNLNNEVDAFQEAIDNGANIVNFSGGGAEFSEEEFLIMKSHPEVLFMVSAGNEHANMDISEHYFYPAAYNLKNEIVVGSISWDHIRSDFSNYGKVVKNVEVGENVISYLPHNKKGSMSGTSQATAIKTGKVVAKLLHMCHSK